MNLKTLLLTTGTAAMLIAGCDGAPTRGLPPGGGNPSAPPIAVTSAGITASLEANLTNAFTGLIRGADLVEGSATLDDLEIAPDSVRKAPCAEPRATQPGGGGGADQPTGPCDEQTPEARARDMAADVVADWFNTEDIETETETSVTFLVAAARVCDSNSVTPTRGGGGTGGDNAPPPDGGGPGMVPPPDPPEAPPPANTLDMECVQALAANPIRLAVSSRTEGNLDVVITVGANRAGTIDIDATEVGLTLDLGQLAASAGALTGLIGSDSFNTPDVMEGAIRLSISRTNADQFTAALAITRAIRIENQDDDGYTLQVAASVPTVSATLDGTSRLTTTVNVGAVAFSGDASTLSDALFDGCAGEAPTRGGSTEPGNPGGDRAPAPNPEPPTTGCDEQTLAGRLGLHVPGLTGTAVVDIGSDAISINGFGLGDATTELTLDGDVLAALDLNATHQRRADVTTSRVSDGIETRFRPAVEARAQLNFRHVSDQLTDLPAWLLDEDLRVTFDGAPEPTLVMLVGRSGTATDRPVPPPGGGDGGGNGAPAPPDPDPDPAPTAESVVKVVAGSLSLSSRSAQTIRVGAGECLKAERDGPRSTSPGTTRPTDPVPPPGGNVTSDDGHPFDALSAGACD